MAKSLLTMTEVLVQILDYAWVDISVFIFLWSNAPTRFKTSNESMSISVMLK